MSEIEEYIEEQDILSEDEDGVEREFLAILASLGTTKDYLGKDMTLGDINRLLKKRC